MATQVSLNDGAVASAGALAIQTNGTTQAVSISTGQVATLAQNPILTSGTANGVAYLNGSKVLTTGSALVFDGTNLGLGVTPSAWNTSYKAFQFVAGSIASVTSVEATYLHNAFINTSGNYAYVNTAAAVRYSQSGGVHYWFNAPSGTAGNAITFTQAMTLDASSNLLVGTTSAEGRLSVKSAGSTSASYHTVFRNSAGTGIFVLRDDGRPEIPWTYSNTTASAANMYVDASGIFYRSTSSLKYKTDVQDATHGIADVLKLRAVTYKGKNNGDTIFGGLIAEEVHEAGLTEFVQYAEDGSPDALAYGNMVSLCIKAIQEQNQLIQSLTARITALEGA